MAKYFGQLILPKGIDTDNDDAIAEAIQNVLLPSDPDDYHFDYYIIVAKTSFSTEVLDWKSEYLAVVERSKYLIFPTHSVLPINVSYAIITPDGDWLENNLNSEDDSEWDSNFLKINSNYPDHFAVLLSFHS